MKSHKFWWKSRKISQTVSKIFSKTGKGEFPYKKSLDFPGKSREKGWKFFQAFLGFHGFLKAEKKGKNPGKGWILFQAFSLRQEVFSRLLLCWESLENLRKARKAGKPWCLMTWDFPGKPGLPGKARFLIQILYSQFKKGRKRLERLENEIQPFG